MKPSGSIADLVGNTPLVKLNRFAAGIEHRMLAKCEFLNPGGSVKDRIAFYMVQKAEELGHLRPGATIVEATAGNTGIGLALVAALHGYKLITLVTEKVSKDKVKLLEALGAEIMVLPGGKSIDDPDHMLKRGKAIAEERGGWFADQFFNSSNIEAHYTTTGPELWEQTAGRIDALVVGVGTGGTLTGAGRYLKERKPSMKIVLADPVGSMLADLVNGKSTSGGSYIVEGIGQDFVPGNFDMSLVDEAIAVSDEESVETAKQLLRTEAMFVGSSSGCIASAAVTYAKRLGGKDKMIVAVLPDGGRGYISTIYDDEWLKNKLHQSS